MTIIDPSTIFTDEARAEGATAEEGAYELSVSDGLDCGLRVRVDATTPSRLLLGHSVACEFRLTDLRVSRRHATLALTPKGLRIVDLTSKNGTFVNGLRVNDALLRGGERIRVGESTIEVACVEGVATTLPPSMRFGRVIGTSVTMRRLFPSCERLAATDLAILVEGEVGTGKEALAEAIHDASPRKSEPFVVFDCRRTTATLMRRTLFGDDAGALYDRAANGTLFIAEIASLAADAQAELAGRLARDAGVRLLASTARNLDEEVLAGRFREDLFARLAQGRIDLPPLRDRVGDVPTLAKFFWRSFGGEQLPFPADFEARYADYSWPGNVTELEETVGQLLAAETRMRSPQTSSLPPANPDVITSVVASGLAFTLARDEVVAEFERQYVAAVLVRYHGNVTRAAAASGLARRYFQTIKARQKK